MARSVVIAGAARTPFGAFGGELRSVPIPRLAARAGREALRRAQVDASEVDELVLGVNFPGSDRSIARQTQLECGIPTERIAYTVDRACCSGLTAMACAGRDVDAGLADVAVAGGAENLSLVPYFLPDARWGAPAGTTVVRDQLAMRCPYTDTPRAVQAADEAKRFGIGRRDQDEWALRSQERTAEAIERGVLTEEIVPVDAVSRDEAPRPDTTLEVLASLPTVNGSETVTAGNAPGLSTGAACIVLMTEARAKTRRVTPLCRVVATAAVAGAPERIASIPAVAAQAALTQAGLKLQAVDLIEVNEAFAVVPLVTSLLLAEEAGISVEKVRARMNVNGGAIAIGHPTGASGVRLVITLAMELRRRGGGYGLATMCGGVGEGEAVIIEVPVAEEPA